MKRIGLDIVIVGGGIGGLMAALSLHQAGHSPVIYEAAPALEPLGVGINLLPHAMRELTELGLLEELRELGVEIEDLFYLTKHGTRIWNEPRGLKAGYRWPQIAIHRGDFQMFLHRKVLERLGPDSVKPGHALENAACSCISMAVTAAPKRKPPPSAVIVRSSAMPLISTSNSGSTRPPRI